MVLKAAPTVLIKTLKESIGTPEDFSKRQSFPDYNNKIPVANDDDDFTAALNEMRISDTNS